MVWVLIVGACVFGVGVMIQLWQAFGGVLFGVVWCFVLDVGVCVV